MMSSRQFADRYRSMAGPQQAAAGPPPLQDEWPLPPGGEVILDGAGPVAMFDRLYSGHEIQRARELIGGSGHGRPEAQVYIDTETTGLSGGTGTYAFLVGLGWFEASGFRVRQYFMRHPGEEPALLSRVSHHIDQFDGIVTFNGRAFDLPLIETRFRMHRRDFVAPQDHLDLLHPARSVWKHRLASCSLGSLERAILGVVRENDAPGWLIPSIYFAYLRDRDTRDLIPVIEHNRFDIVSLARLTGIVEAHLAGLPIDAHPSDRLAAHLARMRRGNAVQIEELLENWHHPEAPSALRLMILTELTVQMKRAGRLEDMVDPLSEALHDQHRDIRMYAAEELAKYHEHTRRDFPAALRISVHARDAAALARDSTRFAAFDHRVQRLERKVRQL